MSVWLSNAAHSAFLSSVLFPPPLRDAAPQARQLPAWSPALLELCVQRARGSAAELLCSSSHKKKIYPNHM